MVIACWSPKGGSGVSVVAAALVIAAAATPPGALLVDLDGDGPAVLGAAEPRGSGIAEWLDGRIPARPDELTVDLGGGLSLLGRGRGPFTVGARLDELVGAVCDDGRCVVVDCGPGLGSGASESQLEVALAFASRATRSLLVVRSCYLALRCARRAPIEPSGVVLVRERGRALGPRDVEHAIGVPILAEVDVDPSIARAVDAGQLRSRLPLPLTRVLRRVAS